MHVNYGTGVGYSLTLVRGVSPAELFRRAGAEPRGFCEGREELLDHQQKFEQENPDPAGGSAPVLDREAAVFALTERFTGVHVTEELLLDSEYALGAVPEEQT